MSQPFLTSMKDTLLEEHNLSRTENGAFGYACLRKTLNSSRYAPVEQVLADLYGEK